VRLQGTKDPAFDVTDSVLGGSEQQMRVCDTLSGYILKKDSPSCGMERVRVYSANGHAERTGRGLFASKLMDTYPLLPT
jgi:uncharacterized protein YbbK (DUF523 family)